MRKVILVTGSSSELGKKIVEKFSNDGDIVYAATRNPNKLEVNRNRVRAIKLDVTEDGDCKEAVAKIIKKEGKLDVLVNVAGNSLAGPTLDFTAEDYLSILNINVVGAFRIIQQVVPYMVKRKSGRIINITSLSGLVAFPNFGLYSSSKFALEALGLSLRYELAKNNVWVTNIAPGAIKSEIEKQNSIPHKTAREKFKLLGLLMPMVTTNEIADNILEVTKMKKPPPSVILGTDAKIIYLLRKFLPSSFWDSLQFFVWNRK